MEVSYDLKQTAQGELQGNLALRSINDSRTARVSLRKDCATKQPWIL